VGQQAVDIGAEYSLGVRARSQARAKKHSVAQKHLQEEEKNAKLAEEHRNIAAHYEEHAKEARKNLRYQLERMESDEEVEVVENEAFRKANKKCMAPQKTAKFV